MKRVSALRTYFASLVGTAILGLFGTTFCLQAFEIPSESMEDTLLVGDRPLVDRLAYAPRSGWMGSWLPYREIARGDIVVFKHPADPERPHLVKRVIGLPGDRVRIARGLVMVNGRFLDEPYAVHKTGTLEEFRDNFPAPPLGPVYPRWAVSMAGHVKDGWLVVPPGDYFVMGDNRDYSLDSRYWGFLPRENIIGQPILVLWSFDKTGADYKDRGPAGLLAGTFRSLLHFSRQSRWRRAFLVIHGGEP